jgi:RHS repeat-associated protein
VVVQYTYDAWGRLLSTSGTAASTLGLNNPLRYRGYIYDTETGLYYLQSRYYNPTWGRFINADSQLSTGDVSGLNLFAYCGNNPVNRIDPTGEAWYHWLIGGVVVAACAVATVATCGGFSAAITSIGLVSHGIAAASTAATVATAAFIGSATAYGTALLTAASNANSLDEFYAQGNWGTVAATTFFGSLGALDGYKMHRLQTSQSSISNHVLPEHKSGRSRPSKNPVPNGSYTQYDDYGDIYSYAQYDGLGRQTLRIDFQGSPHNGVLPHIHLYTYPELGGKGKYVFDLMWNLID